MLKKLVTNLPPFQDILKIHNKTEKQSNISFNTSKNIQVLRKLRKLLQGRTIKLLRFSVLSRKKHKYLECAFRAFFCSFTENAKTSAVRPIHEKESGNSKINYGSLSLVYERLINDTLLTDLNMYLSKFISVYRKNYSSNYVLLRFIEDWKQKLDKGYF